MWGGGPNHSQNLRVRSFLSTMSQGLHKAEKKLRRRLSEIWTPMRGLSKTSPAPVIIVALLVMHHYKLHRVTGGREHWLFDYFCAPIPDCSTFLVSNRLQVKAMRTKKVRERRKLAKSVVRAVAQVCEFGVCLLISWITFFLTRHNNGLMVGTSGTRKRKQASASDEDEEICVYFVRQASIP